MKSITQWKDTLRAALREAMRGKQMHAVTVLREVLAALDNAEAADLSQAPKTQDSVFAGSVAGLGAGEVPRRILSEQEATALIERELKERRDAIQTYRGLGRDEEAEALQRQLEVLTSLM
jgi:uncharacterized protein YqeY